MSTPQFRQITDADWKRSLARARATRNDISEAIREQMEDLASAKSGRTSEEVAERRIDRAMEARR